MHQKQSWTWVWIVAAIAWMMSALSTAPGISTASGTSSLEEAALQRINSSQMAYEACGTPFEVGEMRQDGQWGLLSLVCWPPKSEEPVEVVVPSVILFAIGFNDGSGWDVYLETTEDYLDKLVDLPESLLCNESKELLLASSSDLLTVDNLASPEASSTGLPWQQGSTWYYRTSIHDSNNALDFASPCGTVGEVRAADAGVVVWAYETCMLVERSDGLQIGYQHIEPVDIANWHAGDPVYHGSRLGNTTLTYGCGGPSFAHHVHFWLQNIYPDGSTFGGWTLNDPWLLKGDASRYPDLGCVAGLNDIFYEGTCCGCLPANCCYGTMAQADVSVNEFRWADPGVSNPATSIPCTASGMGETIDATKPAVLPKTEQTADKMHEPISGNAEPPIMTTASITESAQVLTEDPIDPLATASIPVQRVAVEPQRTPPTSASYRISKSVFGSGGGAKTSTHYVMNTTQGQSTDLSRRTSVSYVLVPGYWGISSPRVYDYKAYLPMILRDH